MQLTKEEIKFMLSQIERSDPLNTIEEFDHRVQQAQARVDMANEELTEALNRLAFANSRESFIDKLHTKLLSAG